MERERLIVDMATAEPRYRAVGANGVLETGSSTDEEMLDITTDARFEYTDLADKSQGGYTRATGGRWSKT